MKKNKKLNNKGFSLVELIIVVAIMAVLVGVLAPQYMRYIDRSRAGIDEQYADNVRQAMQTCLMDPTITGAPAFNVVDQDVPQPAASAAATDFWLNVYNTLGVTTTVDLESELALDNSSAADMEFAIDANGNVTITVEGGDYTTYPISVG